MLYKRFPRPGCHQPKIRCRGFEESWEYISLGDLGTIYTGLTARSRSDFGCGSARYVPYKNVFKHTITDTTQLYPIKRVEGQTCVRYGDVFFTLSSEVPEEVGLSSVWLGRGRDIYLNTFCFGYRPKIDIDPYFLAYILRSPSIRQQIIFLAQGVSRFNVSRAKIMKIKIPIPSRAEQQKIGVFFKTLDYDLECHLQKINKLETIKKSMLHKLFPSRG